MQTANRYYDRYFSLDAVKILPGEYYVTRQQRLLVTVLGSCVAACLRDPVAGIIGMNHFMLPEADAHRDTPISARARYGAFAMEMLINDMIKAGAHRERLQAKVFGGGAVLGDYRVLNVGERNARFVLDYLRYEGIVLLSHDLLGDYPRKVYFFPQDGRVKVKLIKRLNNNTILDRETRYAGELQRSGVGGETELF